MHVRGAATRAQATHLDHLFRLRFARSYRRAIADCRFAYINICCLHLLQLYLNSAVEYAGLTQSEGGRVGLGYIVQSATLTKAKRPWRMGARSCRKSHR